MNNTLYDMALNASDVLQVYLVRIVDALPMVLGALLLLLLFWLVGRWAAAWAGRAVARTGAERHVVRLLERAVGYGFILLGIVTALGTVGVDLTALVATLGVAGFAISFAFQDIFGNFLAGVLIMLQRPFKLGDRVAVAGAEGVIEDIRIRDTLVRVDDGRLIVVPNKNILNGTITNFTANKVHRVEAEVTLSGKSLDELRQACLDVVHGVPAVAKEPPPEVLAGKVAGGTVTVYVRCWVDTQGRTQADARAEVVEALHKGLPEASVTPR
ncbi:MAG: mechanosensitive ion channel family protein [Limnochordales bacterium]|nr:mechanosensitive ion channel family protein [Limnochordales bacterium]